MTDYLPKLDLNKDRKKLTSTDLINMQRIQQINLERVARLKQVRKKNLYTAAFLMCSVIGIYAYTIKAVKQEEFLDDFNEPEKVSLD